jgi:mutator protein MutT
MCYNNPKVQEGTTVEYNDIYDADRRLTGRLHQRGKRWAPGEYGLVVCVWVYDGRGHILLTRRAPGKSFAGTWENSGGAAQAGEDSLTAISRELREETGIVAQPEEFELLRTVRDNVNFYDHYCLRRDIPLEDVVLQPGETDDAKWVTFSEIHDMIRRRQICSIISQQFLKEEAALRQRQSAQ